MRATYNYNVFQRGIFRMKNEFKLAWVVTFAGVILAGCGSERRDCVDASGKKLPDSACTTYRGGAGYYGAPRFIYGGSQSGGRILGGSATPSVSRGGFGSMGSGFS
jgi:hypothetical protein